MEPLFGAFFWPWGYFTYAEVRISRQQGFVLWVLGLEYMSAIPNFIPPDTFALVPQCSRLRRIFKQQQNYVQK